MNKIKFNHWKVKRPISGEGKSLLLWVQYNGEPDNTIQTTGIYYKACHDEYVDSPEMFVDYQSQVNDEYAEYIVNKDGNLIDPTDGTPVDIYWAYADPVYGNDPFNKVYTPKEAVTLMKQGYKMHPNHPGSAADAYLCMNRDRVDWSWRDNNVHPTSHVDRWLHWNEEAGNTFTVYTK